MHLATHALLAFAPSLLLLACSGAPEGPKEAAADAGIADVDDGSDGATSVVYIAARGVSTPWLQPPVGPPRQLGPRRGSGYGLGEGEVSYPDVTPDGKTLVVVFYTMNTPSKTSAKSVPILFALPMDGAGPPVRIATAKALRALDRAYTAERMAYVDGSSVFVARLDGSDADEPRLVAQHTPAYEVSALRWLPDGKRIAYSLRPTPVGGAAQLHVVDTDTAKPTPVTIGEPPVPATGLAAALPDGRLIVRGPDQRLHRVGGETPSVALTPPSTVVTVLGLNESGTRLAVVLRQGSQGPRRLVTLPTDGSGAMHELTPKPTSKLQAILSRDRAAVAWVAWDGADKWAVWHAGLEATAKPRQLSPWTTQQPTVTALDEAAGVLLGARKDGAVLRYRLDGPGEPQAPQPPQVLATVSEVVNHSYPWPNLSVDATHVLFDTNTTSGWRGWTHELSSGKTVQHAGPWYRKLITPWGFITRESVHEEAAFVRELVDSAGALAPKAPRQLTPWRNTPMSNAGLFGASTHLVFASELPVPGWYAAPTAASAGADPSTPAPATLVMPRPPGLPDHMQTAWLQRPPVVANHLVRESDGALQAFPLHGKSPPLTLSATKVSAWTTVSRGKGTVLWAHKTPSGGLQVSAAQLPDGAANPSASPLSTVPVMSLANAESIHGLVVLGAQQPVPRVLAAVREADTLSLYTAAVDGSEHAKPRLLASGLPGLLLNLLPTEDGRHVLAVLSVAATAVPHPDMLLAIATHELPAAPASAAYPIAPKGFVLWGCGVSGCQQGPGAGMSPRPPVVSEDGSQVALAGTAGLHSARLDGFHAAGPVLLGSHTQTQHGVAQRRGDRLLLLADKAVHITTLGVQGSQRQLTSVDPKGIAGARWVGERVVFIRGGSQSWAEAGRLYVIDAGAQSGEGTPLVSPDFGVRRLVAALPGGAAMLVESDTGGDHSLYVVPLDGGAQEGSPQAATPIDDTSERFVGFR